MPKMKTGAPTQKVIVASVAAAATTIIITLLSRTFPDLNLAQIQGEMVTIVTFFVGYMMPPSRADVVET